MVVTIGTSKFSPSLEDELNHLPKVWNHIYADAFESVFLILTLLFFNKELALRPRFGK